MNIYGYILILIASTSILSFSQDTLYFDYFDKTIKKKNAYYSRVENYNDAQTNATIKEKYISGKAKSFKKITRNSKGDLISIITEWYENGNPKSSFSLINNRVQGDLNYYREKRGLYFKKTFENDSLITTIYIEEDGTIFSTSNDSSVKVLKHDPDYKLVETMPEFRGGTGEMFRFIRENLKYPMISAKAGHEGKVYIIFIVDEFGSIKFPIILKGIDIFIDAEALRLVAQMPKWKPGTIDGRPVRVKFTMPIKFTLN